MLLMLLSVARCRDRDIHTMKPAAGQPRRNEYGRECMKVRTDIFFLSNISTVYSGHIEIIFHRKEIRAPFTSQFLFRFHEVCFASNPSAPVSSWPVPSYTFRVFVFRRLWLLQAREHPQEFQIRLHFKILVSDLFLQEAKPHDPPRNLLLLRSSSPHFHPAAVLPTAWVFSRHARSARCAPASTRLCRHQ